MSDLEKQLHEEHGQRWIGKPEYSCLTCSHSMSTDNDELVCVVAPAHKMVEERHLCKKWN